MVTSCAKDSLTIVCDPLSTEYGPVQPPILIAKCLIDEGYSVQVLSTTISEHVHHKLESMNISAIDLGKKLFSRDHPSLVYFKSWVEESFLSLNSRKASRLDDTVLNFSNTIAVPSKALYGQGPLVTTLENIKNSLPLPYGMVYGFVSPFLKSKERKFIKRLAEMSRMFIANSRYLAGIYTKMGVNVSDIIYPPLDCDRFKPVTTRPSGEYVLTYFGKETDFSTVKKTADLGVKIVAFGSKLSITPRDISRHKNITVLGELSNCELVNRYSNALFTFYPFKDEPFGYVPVESMACGTPVLTFNRQGPSESVINEVTGWLVNSDREIVNTALELWKTGYPAQVRQQCIERALFFEAKNVTKKWIDIIKKR